MCCRSNLSSNRERGDRGGEEGTIAPPTMRPWQRVCLLLACLLGNTAQLSGSNVSSDLPIKIGAIVELQYLDVEGKGGFSHQDSGINKVETRSPQIGLDKAVLSLDSPMTENLDYYMELKMLDSRAYLDRHYLTLTVPRLNTKLEVGKNKPFINTSRRTEIYPLIGSAYWRTREYHIVSETNVSVHNFEISWNLSLAQQRPLGTREAAKDQSFKMLVYGESEAKDGQTFEKGAGLSLGYEMFRISAWGFVGSLIDDYDWKNQLSQSIQHYDSLGDPENKTHYWYGARFDLDPSSTHLRAEYIRSKDGLLPRWGYYGELSHRLQVSSFPILKSIEPLFRLDKLDVQNLSPQLANPLTWDRTMKTFAVILEFDPTLSLNLEYYQIEENTGAASEIKDNQFLTRLKLEM